MIAALEPPEPTSALRENRWGTLWYVPEQARLWNSTCRFCVIEGPRRSGKTLCAKRKGSEKFTLAPLESPHHDWFGAFFAPTRDQVRSIYWDWLLDAIPSNVIAKVSHTDLTIKHVDGPMLACIGMDKPARAEGRPIDWAGVDEFANMKPDVWERHLRPALDTPGRPGSAWIYGVPRPSAQFAKLADLAKSKIDPDWDYFWWPPEAVHSAEALAAAKRDLDPLTYEQEYGAKRVPLSGRAYYAFDRSLHLRDSLPYDPNAALVLCMDFNVSPGSAVICQEGIDPKLGAVTMVLGEIRIPRDSNTPLVCRKFIADWGSHRGAIHYYGDPTGGNRGTAKLDGSDWDIVAQELRPHFGGRVYDHVERRNLGERARVNAVNRRLLNAAGEVRMLIAQTKAPSVVLDCEHMLVKEGSDGALWKEHDLARGHWMDGVGYYLLAKFPTTEHVLYQGTL
jgi:hypothetical protein